MEGNQDEAVICRIFIKYKHRRIRPYIQSMRRHLHLHKAMHRICYQKKLTTKRSGECQLPRLHRQQRSCVGEGRAYTLTHPHPNANPEPVSGPSSLWRRCSQTLRLPDQRGYTDDLCARVQGLVLIGGWVRVGDLRGGCKSARVSPTDIDARPPKCLVHSLPAAMVKSMAPRLHTSAGSAR